MSRPWISDDRVERQCRDAADPGELAKWAIDLRDARAHNRELREALAHARDRIKDVLDLGIDEDTALKVAARLHDEWTLLGRALAPDSEAPRGEPA